MSSKSPKTIEEIQRQFISRKFTESKVLRKLIDRRRGVKQYLELNEQFQQQYDKFVAAYNEAIKNVDKRTITSSKQRFQFDNGERVESFEIGTATRFINKKANFRTIHRYLNKIIPDMEKSYQLGHKNISILRASIALALDATEDAYTVQERKSLLALYTVVQQIDKLDTREKIQGVDKDYLIDKVREIAEKGPDLRIEWKKDVNVVKGISGSIVVEAEFTDLNQFKGRLAAWAGEIFSDIVQNRTDKFTNYFQNIDISQLKGSPTLVQDAEALVMSTISDFKKNKNIRIYSENKAKPTPTKTRSSYKSKQVKSANLSNRKRLRQANPYIDKQEQEPLNYFSFLAILDKRLPATVMKNMEYPALENRTGRFANSVKAVDVIRTPKGFPSIGYTYQMDPYQIFEPGGRMGSTERDPKRLIDRSIREIASEYAMMRFYTRRV